MSFWNDLLDLDWGDVLTSGVEWYLSDKARGKAARAGREATEAEDALLRERLNLARQQGDIADISLGRSARLEGRGEQLIGDYLSRTAPVRDRITSLATKPIDPNVEAGLAAADFAAADEAARGTLQRQQARAGISPNSGAALEQARLASLDSVAGKVGAMTNARRNATERELQRLAYAQDANRDLATLGESYLGRSDRALGTASSALSSAGASLRSVSDVYGERANQAGRQAAQAGAGVAGAIQDLIGGVGGKLVNSAVGKVKDLIKGSGGTSGLATGVGGAAALGSVPAGAVSLFGPNAVNLGRISAGSLFGTSGSAAAGAGAGSLGGASLADVTGRAIPTTLEGLGTGGAGTAATGAGGSTLGTVTKALPYLGAALGGYNTYKAIEAGKPKTAALSGATTGASLGSIIPGLGTIAGGLIGGAIGAIGGALNKDYKEEDTRDSYYAQVGQTGNFDTRATIDPKTFYESVAGEFRGSHSKYPPRASGKYGKKDEDVFIRDMANKINQAYAAGVIGAGDDAVSIMQKVIEPWFQQEFGGWRGDPRFPNLIRDQKLMTLDLINRYITGTPVEWAVIRGEHRDNPVPPYAGLAGTSGGTSVQPVKMVSQPSLGMASTTTRRLAA